MNPILSEGCDERTCAPAGAAPPARSPTHAHSVTARVITHLPKSNDRQGDPAARAGPSLEEVAELEMQLPAGGRLAEDVGAVEPVRPVDADGTEWRDDAEADTGAAQQAGRIELPGARPHVAGVVERRHVEHLRQPRAHLAGHREVGLSERAGARLAAAGARVEPVRGDRELVVAAERDAVLRAAHREELIDERRGAEHEPGAGRQPHDELDAAARGPAARERCVPATLEVHALEVSRAPERAAALRDADRMHRPRGGDRHMDPGIPDEPKDDGA